MPPVVWVFIALFSLAHGHTVVKGDGAVWKGKDPAVHTKGLHQDHAPEYIAWTEPRNGATSDQKRGCSFTLYARVNHRGDTRLQVNDVEQLLDDSWKFSMRIKEGEVARVPLRWVDPLGGFTLEERPERFRCDAPAGGFELEPADLSGLGK